MILRLGIAYGTPPEKLARVPEIIRAAAEREKNVKFDRSNFTIFGVFALMTESVYSVNKVSYAEYMSTQERIHLEIYRQLSAEQIEIAHQPPVVGVSPANAVK